MSTTTTNIPALIPEDYEPGIRDTFYTNTEMFKAFPPGAAMDGGSRRWKLGTDGTDNSRATSEGASAVTPNTDSAIKMEVDYQAFDVGVQLTHESIDHAARNDVDPWTWSIDRQTKYLVNKVNTTLMTTWEAAVAATGTYGGQTRTSYSSALVSYAESTTASLSYSYMATMMRTLMDANRGVPWEAFRIYMSPTLLFRYGSIANQSTTVSRTTTRATGGRSDAGLVFTDAGGTPTFEGVPIVPMVGMTATTIIMGPGAYPDECRIDESVAPRLSPLGKVARDHRALIDCEYQVWVRQPALWGVLTNKS